MDIHITSFGYLHAPAPADTHLTLDLRHFRDPHLSPQLRQLTAHDRPVRRAVRRTPGIRPLLAATVALAQSYARSRDAQNQPLRISTGCAGGRHRAAVTAHLLARRLRRRGHQVTLHHRDLHRPVVQRAPSNCV